MLLDITLGTRTAWKILLVLAEAPGKAVTRKEIRTLTNAGNKVISKFLLLLEKNQLVTVTKIGKTNHYKINMSNPFTEHILKLIKQEKNELNNPDFTILNILRDFTYELTNTDLENIDSIILFGSHAKRTATDKSDIDVAVILNKKNPNTELLITEIIENIKKRYKKEIQPHYYHKTEFEKDKSKLAQEIRKDGIQLL